MAYMLYGIYVAPAIQSETTYDPFQVLGIAGSATDKQIKKHYKKLSLQLSVYSASSFEIELVC
jgi:translocation protein SEC63